MYRVLKHYKKIVKRIDRRNKVALVSWDWSCYPTLRTVNIPQLTTEEGEQEFLQSIKKKLPNKYKTLIDTVPVHLWSLYHELGHLETNTMAEDKKNDFLRSVALFLYKIGLKSIGNKIYYNLTDEKFATTWAIDYVIHHLKQVERDIKRMNYVYYDYYNRLGV